MRSLGQNVAGTRKEIGHVSDTSVCDAFFLAAIRETLAVRCAIA